LQDRVQSVDADWLEIEALAAPNSRGENRADILREHNDHDLVQRLFESPGRWDVPRAFSEIVFPMGQR
jgi:hypothetical protein